jgi:hypothetical protein
MNSNNAIQDRIMEQIRNTKLRVKARQAQILQSIRDKEKEIVIREEF